MQPQKRPGAHGSAGAGGWGMASTPPDHSKGPHTTAPGPCPPSPVTRWALYTVDHISCGHRALGQTHSPVTPPEQAFGGGHPSPLNLPSGIYDSYRNHSASDSWPCRLALRKDVQDSRLPTASKQCYPQLRQLSQRGPPCTRQTDTLTGWGHTSFVPNVLD